jgi:flagellar protein FlgJ
MVNIMGIAIGSDSLYSANAAGETAKTDNLKTKLQNNNASDKELMDVCKSFEAYLLEQAMKEMKKSVESDEDKNDYLEQFGDKLYEEYADKATEGQGLGIAQMLYEAMKRNA